MTEPKFSTFIVGMIIVSAIAAIFALAMADLSKTYNVEYDDNFSLDVIDKLGELNATAMDIKSDTITDARDKSPLSETLDMLGALFKSGYNAVVTSVKSFNIFQTMVDSGLSKIGLGKSYEIIRTAIILSVMVIIIIGIVISILVRRSV